jgi:hypothetical protein
MSTFAIVVIVLAVAGGITYLLTKKGKIQDANNNNIPDVVEEKFEEVVAKAKEVKQVVKKTTAKVKKVADVAGKVAKEVTKKPATKKTASKKSVK